MAVTVDPRLQAWIDALDPLRWACALFDSEYRFVWASDELMRFAGTHDPDELGLGEHVAKAWTRPAWISKMDPDSVIRLLTDSRNLIDAEGFEHAKAQLPDGLKEFMPHPPEGPPALIWTSWFNWDFDEESRYRVNMTAFRINDNDGTFLGCCVLTFQAVRPNLLVLLASGDESMFERMAELVEPKRRRTAVLLCELSDSGALARRLSTAAYFDLRRKLTAGIDSCIARHLGVSGRHGGELASGFFLVQHLGSDSAAAAAAIQTAWDIQELVSGIEAQGLDPDAVKVNCALNWGGNLVVGQIVPGGRLEVSALGIEMTECEHLLRSTLPGDVLASKTLIEHLDVPEARKLDLDLERFSYTPLGELPSAAPAAREESPRVAVTQLQRTAREASA